MKKIIGFLMILFFFTIGCAGINRDLIVFKQYPGPARPMEETTYLIFDNPVFPSKIDNEEINNNKGNSKTWQPGLTREVVELSPGKHELIIDYFSQVYDLFGLPTITFATSNPVNFDFKKGYVYKIIYGNDLKSENSFPIVGYIDSTIYSGKRTTGGLSYDSYRNEKNNFSTMVSIKEEFSVKTVIKNDKIIVWYDPSHDAVLFEELNAKKSFSNLVWFPLYSPDKNHVALVIKKENNKFSVVIDGDEDKKYSDVGFLNFSSNCKKFSYKAKESLKDDWVTLEKDLE